MGNADEIRRVGQKGCSPVLASAVAYIMAHFFEPISLVDVASSTFASPCYVSRLFQKELGMGYVAYLNGIRVERAKQLLREPGLKIAEISGRIGIPDAHYFARLFKRMTGVSPTRYREMHAGQE